MKEIKVEKDVVLSDSKYYLNVMLDEIYTIWSNLKYEIHLWSILKFVKRRKESYAKDLFLAKEILVRYTSYLEKHIAIFKSVKDYDIDTHIRKYNNACNEVIRNIINRERT